MISTSNILYYNYVIIIARCKYTKFTRNNINNYVVHPVFSNTQQHDIFGVLKDAIFVKIHNIRTLPECVTLCLD